MKKIESIFEDVIFASRWIQAPIYGGLIVAAALYTYKFLLELIHLTKEVNSLTEEVLMLGVLTLVDISMVLNLLIMVIVGGYATFVSRMNIQDHEDRPDWLEKIDAGTLKVKLAGALVGISGIHLLKSFINMANKDPDKVMWQVIIHVVFLFSTLMLAYTEKILHQSHGGHPDKKPTNQEQKEMKWSS
jgi:uncharacterized protein (TIGR00645 family)